MPRNQNSGNLALRNRNRVTNKTRLKVIKGNIEADPIVLDEDEERARVISTAGVDAEDANEHHLQAVLSAASHRATTLAQKGSRESQSHGDKSNEPRTAYIPVPDAQGVVEGWAELYPPNKWVDPVSYVKFSSTVDGCTVHALADGATYFMDERDEEWLLKNNQEARGEGTSAQAAASGSGTTTRSGAHHRSAKSKGKEPDTPQAVYMSEAEFELVMGIFEKVTNDNTPFLHLDTSIPAFTDYQDVFANPLPASMFAAFAVPADIPNPPNLLRMARIVYPYWRDRRAERNGHRIIPTLNYDESDTKNESYICFRRRDVKAIRKTRAAQVTTSDRLLRLKTELASALDLAKLAVMRENQKQSCAHESKAVWEKRLLFVDLKRKFPALGAREDEDILFDKERVPKRPKQDEQPSHILKIRNRSSLDPMSPSTPSEPPLRPRDRTVLIAKQIELHLRRQKEMDHCWDDQIDNPCQTFPVPYAERLFKPVAPSNASDTSASSTERRAPRYFRLRYGRGGRVHLDRRLPLETRSIQENHQEPVDADPDSEEPSKVEQEERGRRLVEQWRFDSDSPYSNADNGADDDDRMLLDDFQPRYLQHAMRFLQEQDAQYLQTDPRLLLPDGHGGVNVAFPFRQSLSPIQMRTADPGAAARSQHPFVAPQPVMPGQVPNGSPHASSAPNATPVAMQASMRKQPTPVANQQVRLSAPLPVTSPYRPSATPPVNPAQANGLLSPLPANATPTVASIPAAPVVTSAQNGNLHKGPTSGQTNGIHVPSVATPGVQSNGAADILAPPISSASILQAQQQKSANQLHVSPQAAGMPNGYTNGLTNNSFNLTNVFPNGYTNQSANHQHALLQQQQQLKMLMAANAQGGFQNSSQATRQAYLQQLAASGNPTAVQMLSGMQIKLPPQRQMQWLAQRAQQQAQQQALANGDATQLQSPSPSHATVNAVHSSPQNGHLSPQNRAVQLSPSGQMLGPNSLSPIAHHLVPNGTSPHRANGTQQHISPPRNMPTPGPSPSLQQQPLVGGINPGVGY